MLRQLLFFLCLALSANGLVAQSSDDAESPESLAVKLPYFAMKEPELLVKKMHPDSLELFRKLVIEFIELTPADARGAAVGVLFDATVDAEQVTKATATKLYVSFLRKLWSVLPREMAEMMTEAEVTAVGSVAEGDLVHVIVRTFMKDREYRKLEVVSFKKNGDVWGCLMGEELEFKIRSLIKSQKERGLLK